VPPFGAIVTGQGRLESLAFNRGETPGVRIQRIFSPFGLSNQQMGRIPQCQPGAFGGIYGGTSKSGLTGTKHSCGLAPMI
jgi:hypothetical protein